MTIFLLFTGLVFLIIGAEVLVRGATRLAAAAGISPLVIGLTVVAFGTSSPELAVSIKSALAGQADIAVGNVVGSNIFNILFILGISALITPLVVSQQLVRLDVPLMIAVSVLLLVLGADGNIGRFEGALLVFGIVAYTAFLISSSRKTVGNATPEFEREYSSPATISGTQWAANFGMVLGGLGLLVLGSQWLVESAITIARYLGVSELIVGLTIVAAGTSLPEVATSIIAAIRGERDIAVGNVVGSNIFNILCVLGLTGVFAPEGIGVPAAAIRFDIPVMIAVAFACLPVFFTGRLIARWEGGLFLGYYIAYTAYLVLGASRHAALSAFSMTMVYFVIPLTILTLAVVTGRALRGGKSGTGFR